MRKVTELLTEEDVTRMMSRKKKEQFHILYYSEWCTRCEKLEPLVEAWKEREGDDHVYLISSWKLPWAYSIFKITSAPALVHNRKGKVSVDVEYPTIYKFFTKDLGHEAQTN